MRAGAGFRAWRERYPRAPPPAASCDLVQIVPLEEQTRLLSTPCAQSERSCALLRSLKRALHLTRAAELIETSVPETRAHDAFPEKNARAFIRCVLVTTVKRVQGHELNARKRMSRLS